MREARSNSGYLGQDDPVLHFGLGKHQVVDVTVTFSSGEEITMLDIKSNQTSTMVGYATGTLDKIVRQWVPVEWSLSNPGYEGNPFDLVAKVTFVHEKAARKS